jgi:hypothetical protein
LKIAQKNAELDSKRARITQALQRFKSEVMNETHAYDPSDPTNPPIPSFESKIMTILACFPTASNHDSHPLVAQIREELKDETEMDEDDELCVVNNNSFANLRSQVTCPIMVSVMVKPVTSKLCKHSFEEDAIFDMIRKGRNGKAKCPVSGCGKLIGKTDLVLDKSLLRKIKKFHDQEKEETQNRQDDEGMLTVD